MDGLRKNSDARIATNRDFLYISQDIEQFKKLQADRTVSLNEREQIKERETNQARQKARDQEREARAPSGLKIYEITVENADQPGLPPALGATNAVKLVGSAPAVNAATTTTDVGSPPLNPTKKAPPSLDPTLNETANILQDYISAMPASHSTGRGMR